MNVIFAPEAGEALIYVVRFRSSFSNERRGGRGAIDFFLRTLPGLLPAKRLFPPSSSTHSLTIALMELFIGTEGGGGGGEVPSMLPRNHSSKNKFGPGGID